jgi:hypothetical protein
MKTHFAVVRNDHDRILTQSGYSVEPTGGAHSELPTTEARLQECSGSGFLLDWLAGGEACKRDIQGFSVGFENLVVFNAR